MTKTNPKSNPWWVQGTSGNNHTRCLTQLLRSLGSECMMTMHAIATHWNVWNSGNTKPSHLHIVYCRSLLKPCAMSLTNLAGEKQNPCPAIRVHVASQTQASCSHCSWASWLFPPWGKPSWASLNPRLHLAVTFVQSPLFWHGQDLWLRFNQQNQAKGRKGMRPPDKVTWAATFILWPNCHFTAFCSLWCATILDNTTQQETVKATPVEEEDLPTNMGAWKGSSLLEPSTQNPAPWCYDGNSNRHSEA